MGGQETLNESGSMHEENKGREHVCVRDLKDATHEKIMASFLCKQ